MSFDNILSSLRSVGNEAAVINSNLVGTTKTGYKATNISYGGTGSQQLGNNTQIPDQNLTTSNTSLDFSQGQLVSTSQPTQFGINGNGFFLLQQIQDVGVTPPNLITRDGSFKFTNIGATNILTTNNGLAVLRDNGFGVYNTIKDTDFNTNNFRPSIVSPTDPTDGLKFSNKGSTVFEFKGTLATGDGQLVEGSLEASNSQLAESVAAMSLNSKKFAAMASQLKVENNNLDTVIGLFK